MWYDNPVISHWTEQAGQARVTVDREFFLSFTGTDRPWAEWLLAELDAAGYSSVSQLRDFVAGANFALGMDRAARRAKRTLGVLSPQALQAPYVQQEWAQRLADDPTGAQRALVLVRVEPCRPEGLLRAVVYVDLVGLDEASARQRLREELAALIRGERRLPAEPTFPGGGPATVVPDVQRPRFPTALPPVWNVPFRRNPIFTGNPMGAPEGLTLIFVDGRLARVDVQAPAQLATHAGIHLGSTEAEVRGAYPGQISTQPHPYEPTGHYLVLKPQAASSANRLLIFETDGRVVTSYRAGERNAAQLIEGCA